MDRTFTTPDPISLYVEIGSGQVSVTAADTSETSVSVSGRGAEETTVEQEGRTISVVGPKNRVGFVFGSSPLTVTVSLPHGSDLAARLGSAELRTRGRLAQCSLRNGSGDLDLEQVGTAEVTAGSGDLRIEQVLGDLSAKAGSGDVTVRAIGGSCRVTTGSGDIVLGTVEGAVGTKSGSGDLRVDHAGDDVSAVTASGEVRLGRLDRGRVEARSASGDIVAGVRAGVPVWTDINTVSGTVRSELVSLGEPGDGQEFIELRLRSVSGDVVVRHLPPSPPSTDSGDLDG